MANERLTHLPCRTCGRRDEWRVKTETRIDKNRVVVNVELYCAHCGKLRAETVVALSEREFSWF